MFWGLFPGRVDKGTGLYVSTSQRRTSNHCVEIYDLRV